MFQVTLVIFWLPSISSFEIKNWFLFICVLTFRNESSRRNFVCESRLKKIDQGTVMMMMMCLKRRFHHIRKWTSVYGHFKVDSMQVILFLELYIHTPHVFFHRGNCVFWKWSTKYFICITIECNRLFTEHMICIGLWWCKDFSWLA